MKSIDKEELFGNLTAFLKSKGVDLQEGSYTRRIRQGCDLLSDTINATQQTVARAKAGAERKLDQLRQSIHDATAPKPPSVARANSGKPAPGPKPATAQQKQAATPKKPAAPKSRKNPAKKAPRQRP